MTKPRRKVVHLEDGEWFRVPMKDHREMCCGCGLVHDVEYRKVGRRIEFRATVNHRATAAARRSRDFEA